MLTFPGHFLGAYLFIKFFGRLKKVKYSDRATFWSMILAMSVDLDTVILAFLGIEPFYHRRFLVHTPIFWFVVFGLFWLTSKILGKKFEKARNILILPFAIAVFSHLILDSAFEGVMWLYPFSMDLYGVHLPVPINIPINEWIFSYLTDPYGLSLELLITSVALYVFIKSGDLKIFITKTRERSLSQLFKYLIKKD